MSDSPYRYAVNKMIKNDSEECKKFVKMLNESHEIYMELNHADVFRIDEKLFAKYKLLTTIFNKDIFDNCHLYLNEDDEKHITKEIKMIDINLSKVINLGYSYYIDKKLDYNKSNNVFFTILIVNALLYNILM